MFNEKVAVFTKTIQQQMVAWPPSRKYGYVVFQRNPYGVKLLSSFNSPDYPHFGGMFTVKTSDKCRISFYMSHLKCKGQARALSSESVTHRVPELSFKHERTPEMQGAHMASHSVTVLNLLKYIR